MRLDLSLEPCPEPLYLTFTTLDTPAPMSNLPVASGFTFWPVLGPASIILSCALELPICPLGEEEKALEILPSLILFSKGLDLSWTS